MQAKCQEEKLGIYCHIPFCIKKCDYCDFNSEACFDQQQIDNYFKALTKEVCLTASKDKSVDTLYIGGGTPSSVEGDRIYDLIQRLKASFCFTEKNEITIEVNPGTVTKEKLSIYKQAGINRVSVGLQAWQDDLLQKLGRIHAQRQFVETMEGLKMTGFKNISVDLMYGLPGQTLSMMFETIDEVLKFEPTHFSCYSLILEEGTMMTDRVEKGEISCPDEETERKMHWMIDETLKKHGFHHYEISSYAKAGYESRHNLKYWELKETLGLGAGAHSFYGGVRFANLAKRTDYVEALTRGELPRTEMHQLSKKEEMDEWMFLGLRKLDGLSRTNFYAHFACDYMTLYKEEIKKLLSEKLLEQEGDYLKLTKKGQDFANQVFMAFI
ncbi:radical SAM family heme chaperone HemW [Eubacteriaceae bacterium ES3]|nr:radical SAM family heme chaperone HemW [Eubacteriaceae bacterium ES3]